MANFEGLKTSIENEIKKNYPTLYNALIKHAKKLSWKDILDENDCLDADLVVEQAAQGTTGQGIYEIMEALDAYDLFKECEGDFYREWASNLSNDKIDEVLDTIIKWYYNKFGDKGYLFFVYKVPHMLRWFLGMTIEEDMEEGRLHNMKGPLHIYFEEVIDRMDEIEDAEHKKEIAEIFIEYLADFVNLSMSLKKMVAPKAPVKKLK